MIWQRPTGTFEIQKAIEPAYRTDFEKKQAYGRLLATGLKPFEAAIQLFVNDTSAALWVSENWPNDDVVKVIAEKPVKNFKLLDKEALADKVLAFADEKDITGRFYVNESAERLKALELYAKIAGHIVKENVVVPITNDNRTMNIRLVAPEKKVDEAKVIEASIEPHQNVVPMRVKLVS